MRKSSSHYVKLADQVDVHDDAKTIRRQLIDRGEKVAGGSGDENINASELRTGGFEGPADRCEIPHVGDNSGNFIASLRNRIHVSTFSCLRLATDTFAPCPAKVPAMPKLIPVVPPKTKTCLSAKSSVSAMSASPP